MLNARQCWPAVSPKVLVQGGQGFSAGAPHGLQLGFGCQVIYVLLIVSDSSHCDFIPGLKPPSCFGKYVVSICVSTDLSV